jgi:hypothetical protein
MSPSFLAPLPGPALTFATYPPPLLPGHDRDRLRNSKAISQTSAPCLPSFGENVTGIESVIMSLMGKASYDGAKALLFPNTKSGESEAIRKSVYESFESAFTKFFAKYGERFGRPEVSFLARQENIDLLVQSLFYSAKNPEEVALNLNGFEDAPPATASAAKELLALLDGELRRHWDSDIVFYLEPVEPNYETVRRFDEDLHVADYYQVLWRGTIRTTPKAR